MFAPNLRYQKSLECYISFWERLNRRSVSLLSSLVDTGVAFQDPYHAVHGVQDMEKVLERRLSCCERLSVRISDFAWSQHEGRGYMFWDMSYSSKKREGFKKIDFKARVSGVSEVLFNKDGQVAAHQEFWGGHTDFDVDRYLILDV